MVTIADVADVAGVSVATVSRVINSKGVVTESTAQAVRAAIAQLNYVPNQQARNLRRNESRNFLVLLPNITNPYYANVFDGINRRAQELDYSVYLCSTDRRSPKEMIQEAISNNRADGAILMHIGYDEQWLAQCDPKFPIVQCCEYTNYGCAPYVAVDNYRGALNAMQYLLQLGHHRIGLIGAANNNISTFHRMNAYRDALIQAGLQISNDLITYCDANYSYDSSLNAAESLLRQENPPTAVFCISDAVALAAVVKAQELGLQIPDKLSIVGFDDVIYTQMLHPHITTVVQPCAQIGRKAVEMLHQLVTKGSLQQPEVLLPHGFIVRESTAPLEDPFRS